MPIHGGRDSRLGSYFQYGTRGKKYYYKDGNKLSEQKAYDKAIKQMEAILSYKTPTNYIRVGY